MTVTDPSHRPEQPLADRPPWAPCADGTDHRFERPAGSDTWCTGCRLRARYREADGRWHWLHDHELWSAAPAADTSGWPPPDTTDAQRLDPEQLDITTTAAEAYELGYLARLLQEDQLG